MQHHQKSASALILMALLSVPGLCAQADPIVKSKAAPKAVKQGAVAASGRVIAKPKVDAQIGVITGDIGIVRPRLAATGEQYRLWMSFIPTPCNDAQVRGRPDTNDRKFECYGELKVNGKVEWKAGRPYAGRFLVRTPANIPTLDKIDVKREGYSLNLGTAGTARRSHEIFVETDKTKAGGQIARIALQLFDADSPPPGLPPSVIGALDDKFGEFNIDLDLGKLGASDGRYYWFWKNTDSTGNAVGSNLYLFVEHVKSIHTRRIPPPPPPPKPKVATGRSVRVETRLHVTNSADGVMDKVVEVAGKLTFDGLINLDVPRTSAGAGADIKLYSTGLVVKYGDSRFSRLRVSGTVYDVDRASDKDVMWKNYYPVDLLGIMRSGRELQVRGDRDSESADLYIRVVDQGEVFD